MGKVLTLDYDNLRGGDRVVCGGKSPFAMVTRIVTAGWKNAFNHDIAVHTGLVIDFFGQKLIAEMQPKGLEINSLKKYTEIGGKRYILDITRSKAFDSPLVQEEFHEMIALYRRRTIEYDYVGLLEFVFKKVDDNKGKNYCSEFDYLITKELGCQYPSKFKTKVSPYDLQNVSGWGSVRNWHK